MSSGQHSHHLNDQRGLRRPLKQSARRSILDSGVIYVTVAIGSKRHEYEFTYQK